MRTERCVCGGDITSEDDPVRIAAAVALHNMSLAHCVWRYRRDGPTATYWSCDVSVSVVVRPSVPVQ